MAPALADVTGCYWPFYGEGADAWQAQPSYGMSRVRVCVCVCVCDSGVKGDVEDRPR